MSYTLDGIQAVEKAKEGIVSNDQPQQAESAQAERTDSKSTSTENTTCPNSMPNTSTPPQLAADQDATPMQGDGLHEHAERGSSTVFSLRTRAQCLGDGCTGCAGCWAGGDDPEDQLPPREGQMNFDKAAEQAASLAIAAEALHRASIQETTSSKDERKMANEHEDLDLPQIDQINDAISDLKRAIVHLDQTGPRWSQAGGLIEDAIALLSKVEFPGHRFKADTAAVHRGDCDGEPAPMLFASSIQRKRHDEMVDRVVATLASEQKAEPDLLSACRALLREMECEVARRPNVGTDAVRSAISDARAAIAKRSRK